MLARPALNVFYTIAGRRVLIETEDDWSAQVVCGIFAGWFLPPLATNASASADATVRITFGGITPHIPNDLESFNVPEGGVCHIDGNISYLDFDGSVVLLGPTATIEVWINRRYQVGSRVLAQIISQAFSAALRRCHVYEFHSAAVAPPGHDQAILIAGESGCGKTTLTLQLAGCGWNYLSDDTLLIDKTKLGLRVYALRKFFALKSDTVAAWQLSQVTGSTAEAKARITPQDLFSGNQIEHAEPVAIVFPTVTHESSSEMRRLSSAEAMTRLLRLCPWAAYDKPTAGKHLGLLGELAKACDTFELLAGTDLLEDRSKVAELFRSCART